MFDLTFGFRQENNVPGGALKGSLGGGVSPRPSNPDPV